jgi:hypothetical protein
MKSKLFIATFIAFYLTGCAQNSGIVQVSSDTYIVSRQAATGFHGMGALKADALREAFAKCSLYGKDVDIIETNDAEPPYIMGNFPKTEIIFKCVKKPN